MKITAWRIYQKRYAKTAFTGEGARLFGGRWNSPGHAVVYLAQSQALAALELLVRLDSADSLRHYLVCALTFSQTLVEEIDPSTLPSNWRRDPAPKSLQALGDQWLINKTSPILRVPSAIVPSESNYLLNPAHPSAKQITFGKPQPFRLDRRLLD